jgi:hypothetical protein
MQKGAKRESEWKQDKRVPYSKMNLEAQII